MIFLLEKTFNSLMRRQMRRQNCNIVSIVSHNKCRHRLILLRWICTINLNQKTLNASIVSVESHQNELLTKNSE